MTPRRFAEHTVVPVARSRAEVERTLTRYGCTKFGTWVEPGRATIQFELTTGRQIQLPIPLPQAGREWTERTAAAETRRRWRVLVLTVKALLEAVDSKLMSVDQAFLAYVVVPGTARTIGDAIVPRLDALYAGDWRPALLSENPSP